MVYVTSNSRWQQPFLDESCSPCFFSGALFWENCTKESSSWPISEVKFVCVCVSKCVSLYVYVCVSRRISKDALQLDTQGCFPHHPPCTQNQTCKRRGISREIALFSPQFLGLPSWAPFSVACVLQLPVCQFCVLCLLLALTSVCLFLPCITWPFLYALYPTDWVL